MIQRGVSPTQSSSLAVLVECVVSPLLRKHPPPILLELNIDLDLMTTAHRDHLSRLVESLVSDSLREMPHGRPGRPGDAAIVAASA